jgi:cytochrome c-type biogenesis protein CcmH
MNRKFDGAGNFSQNAIRRAFPGKNGWNTAPVLGLPLLDICRRMLQILPILAVSLLIWAPQSNAQTQTAPLPPGPPELEIRLKKLETELRCLVCQNQTLADSPSGLAGDLRREIRLLADAGKSNDEIKQFLRERYGDFVLYRPPVDNKTSVLWFGPFILLIGGGGLLWWMSRKRQALVKAGIRNEALSTQDVARARSLLDE